MSGYPGIQNYDSPHVDGASVFQAPTDWKNGPNIYLYAESTPPRAAKFAIKSGKEKSYGFLTDTDLPNCATTDASGNFYVPYDASNYVSITAYDPNFAVLWTVGTTASGPTSPPTAVPLPETMCVVTVGNVSWLITAGFGHPTGTGPDLGIVLLGDTPAIVNFSHQIPSGQAPAIVAGPSDSTSATAYILVEPGITNPNQSIGVYSLVIAVADPTQPTVATYTVATLGTIQATALNSTWTEIFNNGLVFDTNDSKIIVNATGSPGASGYIAKIDPADCSVTWKVEIPTSTGDRQQFQFGRVKKGFISYFSQGSTKQVVIINTKTGVFTTTTTGLGGLTAFVQCCDDVTPCIIAQGSFSKVAGSPLQLNDTPDSFTGWYALFIEQIGAITYTYVRILNGAPA